MKEHHSEFSIASQCRYFKVSDSGYYAWLNRKPSERATQRQRLDQRVSFLFHQHDQRYGATRIQRQLQQEGINVNIKTVAKSMKRQGFIAKAAKKFKATTNSKHNLPVAPNLLKQDFSATQPNQKWVGDITYLRTNEGWLYLATVIDLFSRQIIGWSMDKSMTAKLTCDALQMALWKRKFPTGVIFHSDRGSQYCSKVYQSLMADNDVISSMSAKGDCYDNACAESFFHSLKVELIHGDTLKSREELRHSVFDYIECYYNRIRMHSTNGYKSPVEFEDDFYKKLAS